jgi:hypothetical protein
MDFEIEKLTLLKRTREPSRTLAAISGKPLRQWCDQNLGAVIANRTSLAPDLPVTFSPTGQPLSANRQQTGKNGDEKDIFNPAGHFFKSTKFKGEPL